MNIIETESASDPRLAAYCTLTEAQLRKEFEAFGKVDTARVVMNAFNGRSKGFGFVVMPNRPEAEAAIAAMSEKEVLGRKMRVNEARNTLKDEA